MPTSQPQGEKPYLISLRNPNNLLMHAGIRVAANPTAAMEEYLADMPKPFSSYEVLSSSSTHNADHYQFQLAFGPFAATVTSELLTAAQSVAKT